MRPAYQSPGLWQRERLENGLTLLYQQDASLPLTHASLLLRSGSAGESEAQAGLASLTLDIMMEGTLRRTARQIADAMESIGASLGGQGHEDYADFGFVVPSAHLPRAMDVLSDILHRPAFRESDTRKQRMEVLANLSSRTDAIFNVAYDALASRLFPRHAYGRPIEGLSKTVKGFTRHDFVHWHAAHMRPGHMILAVMGPWGFEKTLGLVRRSFVSSGSGRGSGSRGNFYINKANLDSHSYCPSLGPSKPNAVLLRSSFSQAYYMQGYRAPVYGDPLHLPLKLANIAIGGGMSSRMFLELREKRGLAYEVSSFYSSRSQGGAWAFYLGLPNDKRRAARVVLNALLERVSQNGITPKELAQAKRMMRSGYLMENQPRRRKTWYAAWWAMQGKDPDHAKQFLGELEAVTLADVRTAIQQTLGAAKVVVEVVPKRGRC